MKILLTGGAGFIGQYVARALPAGWTATAFDLLNPQVHQDPEASRARFPGEVIVGDVADPAAWRQLERHDAIVHLAAETGTAQSMYERERYESVNIGGTQLAADTAVEWNVPLIALSSRAVYGEGRYLRPDGEAVFAPEPEASPEPSREDDPHHPVSFYGETKSRGEDACRTAATSVPVAIIRPQNVIGYGQALHNPYTGVLAAFLARLREGRELSVYGDGTATRDFVHVRDLAALIVWLLEHPGSPGEARTPNCGSGERTTLTQLAEYARAGSPHPDTPITYIDVHRAGDIQHACADLERLRALGAPAPQWSTEAAVKDFIQRSWQLPGAPSTAWDTALEELAERGLTS